MQKNALQQGKHNNIRIYPTIIMVARWFITTLLGSTIIAIASDDLPNDPRSLFNLGTKLVTSGNLDEATNVLRQAAVVRDKTIAAKALTLLGQIAVAAAKNCTSENPAETPPEQRQTICEHLHSAEQSFAESLSLQPNEEVRQHLETIRAWRHNMTNVWEEYDREQLRNNELQQRIRTLADNEEKLAERVRPLLDDPHSPQKFQVGYESGKDQKKLAKELAMLHDTPVNDEELKEQWKQLPEMQKIADEAAGLLANHRLTEALPKQQQVLDYLRSLLKPEQNQQNQDQNKDKEQNKDQDQNKQEQNQEQSSPRQDQQPQSSEQEPAAVQQNEKDAKERAERLLMQVRRKEQAAEQRREIFKVLQMQAETVEKDW